MPAVPSPDPERHARWWLAALTLVAAWLAFVAPWLTGRRIIPWDAADFYYPVLRCLAQARAAGATGFWNPYLFGGQAAIADPESFIFTPSMSLLASLSAAPSIRLFDGVVTLHLLGGALGLLLLLRRHGLGPAAAMLGALVFMMGGAASGRLQHSLMIVSYGWMPWALLLLVIACTAERTGRRVAAACGFALVAALMAADRDHVAYLNCLMLIAVAAWHVASAFRRSAKAGLRTVAALSPAVPIGLAILALPALLTLDTLAGSNRPEIAFLTAGHGSLQPAALLTLLNPDMFGALRPGAYWGPGRLPWMALSATGYDWTDDSVSHLYVGIVPLLLIAVAAARGRLWAPPVWPYVILFAFALIYALGAYTPAYRLIFELVPGADLYRRPNDAAFALNLILAILAGFAAEAWRDEPAPDRRGLAAIIGVLVLASGAALWLGLRLDHAADIGRALAWTWAMALGGLAALAVLPRIMQRRYAAATIVLLAAADLVLHNSATPFNAHPLQAASAYTDAGRALAARIKAAMPPGDMPYRAEIFGIDGSWQNAALVYGIEQTLGYNPLRDARYDRIVGARQNSASRARPLTDAFTGYASPLARRLGIAVVATGAPIGTMLPAAATAPLSLVGEEAGAFIYRVADPAPRWMLVEPADLARLAAPDPDLAAGLDPDPSLGTVTLIERTPDRLRLRVDLARPGGLVVHDLHHPAWRATVDGADVPILRAALLFRGLPLPAGQHEVTFSFEPLAPRFLLGAVRRATD